MATEETRLVDFDAFRRSRGHDHPDDPAYEASGLSCYLGGPVHVDGELYGTLCFVSEAPRDQPFTDAEQTFVELLAGDADLADATAAALEAAGEDAQVFVYGFADFLDAATDALSAAGADPDSAKVENFG
jgi:GAF domain-containing protein